MIVVAPDVLPSSVQVVHMDRTICSSADKLLSPTPKHKWLLVAVDGESWLHGVDLVLQVGQDVQGIDTDIVLGLLADGNIGVL